MMGKNVWFVNGKEASAARRTKFLAQSRCQGQGRFIHTAVANGFKIDFLPTDGDKYESRHCRDWKNGCGCGLEVALFGP
jgi:hypothetical protein